MTKIINLFGGPGCGKSTTAAGLFYHLKNEQKYKVELVTEYAKELAYSDNLKSTSQMDIIVEQTRRQDILLNKVDLVITDSPIILGAVYAELQGRTDAKMFAITEFKYYNNINFYLPRIKSYEKYGRIHSEEEAIILDNRIKCLLMHYNIPYYNLEKLNSDSTIKQIMDILNEVLST